MSTRYRRTASVFSCLIPLFLIANLFLYTGCKSSNETNSSSKQRDGKKADKESNPNAETIDGESITNNGSKACSNPYYPINTNIERSYKIAGTTTVSYALKQTQDKDDTFSEKRSFDSGTDVIINWSCTPEGLRNAEFSNSISMPKGVAIMKTVKSSGISLPKVWEKGRKFEARYDITMSLKIGKTSAASKGTVTVESEIASIDENVSVQGGDFVAARIDSVVKMNLTVNGKKMPSRDIKMTNWYSPKVGLIKQETKIGSGKSNVEYTGEK